MENQPQTSRRKKSGLTLIELIVVTLLVLLVVAALVPAITSATNGSYMAAVGFRGRDIYMAITGANREREYLGLSTVWPSSNPPFTNMSGAVECFNFDNSTDYFKYIYDEPRFGTAAWSPLVSGFDYSLLAGSGVRPCSNGVLTADCNIWIIAKNVGTDLPDIVPLLITRNVDVFSIPSKLTDSELDASWRFSSDYHDPFRNNGMLVIRKGGGMFKARKKYMTNMHFYNRQTFDATVDSEGHELKYPLEYLPPDSRQVLEDNRKHRGYIASKSLNSSFVQYLKKDFSDLIKNGLGITFFTAILYFVALFYGCSLMLLRKLKVREFMFLVVLGCIHYVALTSLALFINCVQFSYDDNIYWMRVIVFLVAMIGGIVYSRKARMDNSDIRKRSTKWIAAIPLVVIGIPLAVTILILLLTSPVIAILLFVFIVPAYFYRKSIKDKK